MLKNLSAPGGFISLGMEIKVLSRGSAARARLSRTGSRPLKLPLYFYRVMPSFILLAESGVCRVLNIKKNRPNRAGKVKSLARIN